MADELDVKKVPDRSKTPSPTQTDAGPRFVSRNIRVDRMSMEESEVPKGSINPTDLDPNRDHWYKMDHENRGCALVISNQKFKEHTRLSERAGSDIDVASMFQRMTELGFDTDICNDKSKQEIFEALDEVANKDHSESDCFVCVVLSHGDETGIWATDDQFKLEDMMERINPINCPSLAFKPKIFILQACRGTSLDVGVTFSTVAEDKKTDEEEEDRVMVDAMPSHDEYNSYVEEINKSHQEDKELAIKLPTNMDYLIIYSTFEGKGSFRNTSEGSPFIQYLSKVIQEMPDQQEIYGLLTKLNHKMVYEFKPKSEGQYKDFRQMPCFVSTLTKTLTLTKK